MSEIHVCDRCGKVGRKNLVLTKLAKGYSSREVCPSCVSEHERVVAEAKSKAESDRRALKGATK